MEQWYLWSDLMIRLVKISKEVLDVLSERSEFTSFLYLSNSESYKLRKSSFNLAPFAQGLYLSKEKAVGRCVNKTTFGVIL